jgi:ABC-type glutathione transport system ATPase component
VGIEGNYDGDLATLISDQQTTSKTPSDARQVFERRLYETLQKLSSSVQRVYLIEQVPYQTLNPEHEVVRAALNGEGTPMGVTRKTHQQRQRHAHKIMEQVTAKFENVFLLDPTEHCFAAHNQSIITVSRGVLYADNDHVSPIGAEVLLRPLLEPVIIEFK